MHYRIFQYPLPAPPELEELNACLANQRVVACTHEIVRAATGPMLLFVVQTVGQTAGATAAANGRPDTRIDYKLLLGDAQFSVYERLRRERKQIADGEGVPPYAVFTNAQLAEIVRRRATTTAELSAIDGIGEARAQRYGPRILPLIGSAVVPPVAAPGAAGVLSSTAAPTP